MTDNEKIVRDFINAWPRLNAEEIVSYFTPDGVYHNIPMEPVAGRENLKRFIASFLQGWSEPAWEVVNIVSHGDLVVAERVDRMKVGGKRVSLPCCGVFEMQNGKIKAWRDYFDLATYTKQLSG